MPPKEINLGDFKSEKSRVYSGRQRGAEVRRALQLDQIDQQEVTVVIKVPDDTFSINTSFFLGLFGESVRAIDEEQFKQKYQFVASNVIQKNIAEGIERALKEKSVL